MLKSKKNVLFHHSSAVYFTTEMMKKKFAKIFYKTRQKSITIKFHFLLLLCRQWKEDYKQLRTSLLNNYTLKIIVNKHKVFEIVSIKKQSALICKSNREMHENENRTQKEVRINPLNSMELIDKATVYNSYLVMWYNMKLWKITCLFQNKLHLNSIESKTKTNENEQSYTNRNTYTKLVIVQPKLIVAKENPFVCSFLLLHVFETGS